MRETPLARRRFLTSLAFLVGASILPVVGCGGDAKEEYDEKTPEGALKKRQEIVERNKKDAAERAKAKAEGKAK